MQTTSIFHVLIAQTTTCTYGRTLPVESSIILRLGLKPTRIHSTWKCSRELKRENERDKWVLLLELYLGMYFISDLNRGAEPTDY